MLADFAPDEIYHLAAYHRSSATDVRLTEADEEQLYFRNNVEATRGLLRSAHELLPRSRVFLAGSCHLFGHTEESPQSERTPIRPNNLYGITKAIHNALHGAPATVSSSDWDHFFDVNRAAARDLELDGDLIMIHDPQPAALAAMRRRPGQTWVWRCHIDLSAASPEVWEVIGDQVAYYDSAIFSHHAFVPALGIPAYLVPPSIDPLSDKNRAMDEAEERALLAPFELPARKPLAVQVSRFDRLKDPVGVIDAFVLSRRWEDSHLVLAGGSADDDPEGAEVLAEVRARAAGRTDVTLLSLPPDAHLVINALQRRAAVVVQKSLREGFALTVSEALWKQRAVIAGAVGGIPLQVIHDRTGVLVRSVEGCAYQIARLLRSPDLRRRLGRNGHEHVRQSFLLPREARDYLGVFARALVTQAASREAAVR